MSSKLKSRWDTETAEDAAEAARRKAEKEAKKALKLEKARKAEEEAAAAAARRRHEDGERYAQQSLGVSDEPPSKRRKVSAEPDDDAATSPKRKKHASGTTNGDRDTGEARLLRFPAPEIKPCNSVDDYEPLNRIEEGSYGIVSRARHIASGEVVALKKLKLEGETDGFPITSLREIQTLMAARHANVVNLREVVVGEQLNQVYIVMDFIEHDLKTLLDDMPEPFLQSEVKTLMLQLLSATATMHTNWIMHRDLKTSNLLMNNRGQIKVADFGLARYFGDPCLPLTQLVVTLWYRSPELLLGAQKYGTAIDIWSIGCIFAELILKEPLFQGKSEIDQLSKIFELMGVPTDEEWPGWRRLPNSKSLRFPRTKQTTGHLLRSKFPLLTTNGVSLLSSLLSLDPSKRITAEEALKHPYFRDDPKPKSEAMFPTFPSKAGQEKRRRLNSPSAPMRGDAPQLFGEVGLAGRSGLFAGLDEEEVGGGFSLKVH
ncbi:Serine/threonine-protein kinase ppk23 [Orbilia oligospora]|uniref:cyclin-dependent kinase n=1 Tax=Orbilia oligospora TaxID=2813651 RepID=A0A7C8VNA8_ORBOL|nr:Serine/threonine-protein kinase ppk23 [Orbilia oligospora]